MATVSRTLQLRGGRSDDVLNLCFHGIGAPGRELEPGEENYWIGPAKFEELLDVIVRFPSVRIVSMTGTPRMRNWRCLRCSGIT